MLAKYALIPDKETCEIHTEEIAPGSLGPNEILVRSEFSMVSAGTELAAFCALSPGVYKKCAWNAYPWRPGYGMVGTMIEYGDDVSKFSTGMRIFCFGKHASLQKYALDLKNEESGRSAFIVSSNLGSDKATALCMGLVAITAPQVSGVLAV